MLPQITVKPTTTNTINTILHTKKEFKDLKENTAHTGDISKQQKQAYCDFIFNNKPPTNKPRLLPPIEKRSETIDYNTQIHPQLQTVTTTARSRKITVKPTTTDSINNTSHTKKEYIASKGITASIGTISKQQKQAYSDFIFNNKKCDNPTNEHRLLPVIEKRSETRDYNTPIHPPIPTVTPITINVTVTVNPTTTNSINNTSHTKEELITSKEITASTGAIGKQQKPGYAFIFNNENFDDPSTEYRVGSRKDTIRLQETFKKYGMITEVYTNYTVEQIKGAIDTITCVDYSSHACLLITLLSHGNRNDMICAKNGSYSINDDVLFPILRNRTLDGKPKILFIQACKGSRRSNVYYTDSPGPISTANEVLKFYSTFEGYVAYREENGSVFIRTLCKYLKKYGEDFDIEEIIKIVITKVKEETQGDQIPSITSTLIKKFKFGDYH